MLLLFLFFVVTMSLYNPAFDFMKYRKLDWKHVNPMHAVNKRDVGGTQDLILQGQGLMLFNLSRENLYNISAGVGSLLFNLMDNSTKNSVNQFVIKIRSIDVCIYPTVLTPSCQSLKQLNKPWIPSNLLRPVASDIVIWISLDKKNRHIKVGVGYPDPLNVILDWTDPTPNAQTSAEIGNVTTVEINCPAEVLVGLFPIVTAIPGQVLPSDAMTLDILSNNSAIEYNSLPEAGRELFGVVSGPNIILNRSDADAINYSLDTPGCLLYNKVQQKVAQFGNPDMVYIRVTIGPDMGNSPGSPFVMEIWPKRKSSPVHDHASTVAVIKVLYGEITSFYFNPLSSFDNGQPLPFNQDVFTQGQITYLTPLYHQTHQLFNHRNDTACITLQSYHYMTDDYVHYETFDYISPNTSDNTLHLFLPGSDFTYDTLISTVQKEYAGSSGSRGSSGSSGSSGKTASRTLTPGTLLMLLLFVFF